jgi:hypothetical protein
MVVGFFNSCVNYVILLDVDGYNEIKQLGILFVHAMIMICFCYAVCVRFVRSSLVISS